MAHEGHSSDNSDQGLVVMLKDAYTSNPEKLKTVFESKMFKMLVKNNQNGITNTEWAQNKIRTTKDNEFKEILNIAIGSSAISEKTKKTAQRQAPKIPEKSWKKNTTPVQPLHDDGYVGSDDENSANAQHSLTKSNEYDTPDYGQTEHDNLKKSHPIIENRKTPTDIQSADTEFNELLNEFLRGNYTEKEYYKIYDDIMSLMDAPKVKRYVESDILDILEKIMQHDDKTWLLENIFAQVDENKLNQYFNQYGHKVLESAIDNVVRKEGNPEYVRILLRYGSASNHVHKNNFQILKDTINQNPRNLELHSILANAIPPEERTRLLSTEKNPKIINLLQTALGSTAPPKRVSFAESLTQAVPHHVKIKNKTALLTEQYKDIQRNKNVFSRIKRKIPTPYNREKKQFQKDLIHSIATELVNRENSTTDAEAVQHNREILASLKGFKRHFTINSSFYKLSDSLEQEFLKECTPNSALIEELNQTLNDEHPVFHKEISPNNSKEEVDDWVCTQLSFQNIPEDDLTKLELYIMQDKEIAKSYIKTAIKTNDAYLFSNLLSMSTVRDICKGTDSKGKPNLAHVVSMINKYKPNETKFFTIINNTLNTLNPSPIQRSAPLLSSNRPHERPEDSSHHSSTYQGPRSPKQKK